MELNGLKATEFHLLLSILYKEYVPEYSFDGFYFPSPSITTLLLLKNVIAATKMKFNLFVTSDQSKNHK